MTSRHEARIPEFDLSRREFLAAAGGATLGISALGLTPRAAEGAEKPRYGGSVKIGLRSDISRLDPHYLFPPYPTSNAMALIYNGMTEADYDTNIVPALAQAWETSKDGLVWTWHIRKDVTFHNGRPMTAEDVKANLERVLDPKTGSVIRGELQIIDNIALLDKYTLRTTLKDKYYPLPAMLTNRWVPIIDPQTFDTAKHQPIATGPFKYVSWKRLHTTVMARHETYWEKDADGNALPYLDEVIGKPLADDTVRLTALRTGEVDMIDAVSYRDQARFLEEWTDKFDTYTIKALGTIWYYFNAQKPPFNDVRVRRAAALALDKRAVLDKTLFGHGEIMNQFYTEASPWRLSGVPKWERNVPEAKRLLKEAGVKPGTTLTLITYVRYNYIKEGAQIFQQNLRDIGLITNLKILDWGALTAARKKRDWDIFGLGSAYRMDPHEYYFKELSSESPASKELYGGWVNPVYDRLVDDARRTAEQGERKRLYTEAEKLIHQEVPKVRSISAHNLSAWKNALKGYRPNVAGNITYNAGGFRNAWLSKS
jgi:peptide/nickel transport system substrate-binding protein